VCPTFKNISCKPFLTRSYEGRKKIWAEGQRFIFGGFLPISGRKVENIGNLGDNEQIRGAEC